MIDKIKCNKLIGNDIDELPISLFKAAQDDISILDKLPALPNKEHFYYVRENADKYEKWYRSAILLFGSYNARVYGGCYGAFANTKDGGLRNYFQEAKRNFEKQIPNIIDVEFINKNYLEFNRLKDLVIYLDPPYGDGIGYKNDFNHDEFWEWVREISNENYVLISEYDAPIDFNCLWSMDVKTHMNNRNKIEKSEKLFTYNTGRYAKQYIKKPIE